MEQVSASTAIERGLVGFESTGDCSVKRKSCPRKAKRRRKLLLLLCRNDEQVDGFQHSELTACRVTLKRKTQSAFAPETLWKRQSVTAMQDRTATCPPRSSLFLLTRAFVRIGESARHAVRPPNERTNERKRFDLNGAERCPLASRAISGLRSLF